MRVIQVILILIILFKIVLEVQYHQLKVKLKNIHVDTDMRMCVEENIYNNSEINVIQGKNYAYDMFKKQIVIKDTEVQSLDAYDILIHEYGHCKDLHEKSADYNRFIMLVKTFIPILYVIIFVCICMKYILGIHTKLLLFALVLALVLMIVDLIISLNLEWNANKIAIHILQNQSTPVHHQKFLYMAMVIQIIDRFFLILFILLLFKFL